MYINRWNKWKLNAEIEVPGPSFQNDGQFDRYFSFQEENASGNHIEPIVQEKEEEGSTLALSAILQATTSTVDPISPYLTSTSYGFRLIWPRCGPSIKYTLGYLIRSMENRDIEHQVFFLAPRKMNEIIIVHGPPHLIYVTASLHKEYRNLLRKYGRMRDDIADDDLSLLRALRQQDSSH